MKKWQRGPMAALAALLLLAATAHAQEFRGRVIAVADGDTLTVMRNGAPAKIRLEGIDCPEKNSPSAIGPTSSRSGKPTTKPWPFDRRAKTDTAGSSAKSSWPLAGPRRRAPDMGGRTLEKSAKPLA